MQNRQEKRFDDEKHGEEKEAPLMALNHVSRVCRSVEESVEFYTKALGFVLIKRPESFHFLALQLRHRHPLVRGYGEEAEGDEHQVDEDESKKARPSTSSSSKIRTDL
ncbi:hypothetical protein SASPL_105187 [Salvia splendens]|uniref:Glyoxalase/fosfomycin resistance/dioxygenase domain-containing protein n=1 Tax=Salvia splendens TaxID=180675 RepID=A0A8X9A9R1_SALSN|nr:hypothetical protein SASPL_105187 [Salvia splendens]